MELSLKLKKQLFTLPVRMGGMGVRNPIETADGAYKTSRTGMSLIIVDAIKGKGSFSMLGPQQETF